MTTRSKRLGESEGFATASCLQRLPAPGPRCGDATTCSGVGICSRSGSERAAIYHLCGPLIKPAAGRRPPSLPLEFRLALLQEGVDSFALVLGLEKDGLGEHLEGETGVERHAGREVERRFREPQGDRRAAGELLRQLERGALELLARHHAVDE